MNRRQAFRRNARTAGGSKPDERTRRPRASHICEPIEPRRLLSFVAASAFDTGVGPTSVAAADLNGDGLLDLAVANSGTFIHYVDDGSVGVHLGNGDGTFQAARDFAAGRGPSSVAVADFNGDGRPDLVAANSGIGSDNVSVLLGNGDGSFQAARNFPAGSYPGFVAVADFNGDGRPDLVVANGGSDHVSILLGNGDGSFQAPRSFAAGSNPQSVAVADFNGDGWLDLAVAYWGTNATVSVLLCNGDGSFQAALPFYGGPDPDSVAVGDLNGDGRVDLAVAGGGLYNVTVLLGNGDGSFGAPRDIAAGFEPSFVAVADVNSDDRLDLAVTGGLSASNNNVHMLLGNGDGTFKAARGFAVGWFASFVAVGDFNGDGRPDLAVAERRGHIVSALLGRGDGTFLTAPNLTVPDQQSSFVAAADLNDDGRPDLATTNSNSATVSVLLGNGNGTFQTPQNFATGIEPCAVVARDVDGDGRLDLVTANKFGESVSVLLGNGNGTFRAAQNFAAGRGPIAVETEDVNDDSRLDLVVANEGTYSAYDDGSVSVLLGNGDGTFRAGQNFAANRPRAAAVGEFNGDGHPDLVVANAAGGDVSVHPGNGDGTFQPALHFAAGDFPSSMALGEFNGDGRPDLAVANVGGVRVLLGNGDGTLQAAWNFATNPPWSVAAGDVNGDGWPDLVVTSPAVRVLLGNGDGTFRATHVSYVAAGIPRSVALPDLNGDTFPDAATANYASNDLSILLNDGNWATKTWIGPTSAGTWSTADNWSPIGVPAAVDVVSIAGSAVTLSDSATIRGLNLTGGATLTMVPAGDRVLRTSMFSIAADGESRLDLNDNALILDYTGATPAAAVRAMLVSGYAAGAWNGPGISSSAAAASPANHAALGFGESAALGLTSFAGQAVDSTSLLVRYTVQGDANLDGTTNLRDFNALAANFGATSSTWIRGDFNYDANTNLQDFSILASRFGQAPSSPQSRGESRFSSGRSEYTNEPRLEDLI